MDFNIIIMKFAVLSRKETQKKKNLSYRKPTLSQFNFCFNLKKFGWDFLSLGKHNSSDNRKCVCVCTFVEHAFFLSWMFWLHMILTGICCERNSYEQYLQTIFTNLRVVGDFYEFYVRT